MSTLTSAYKRTIEPEGSNQVEVELLRALPAELVRLHVGDYPGATAYMTIARLRELREALDEVIMVAELAAGPHEHQFYADMDEARANCPACLAGVPA